MLIAVFGVINLGGNSDCFNIMMVIINLNIYIASAVIIFMIIAGYETFETQEEVD